MENYVGKRLQNRRLKNILCRPPIHLSQMNQLYRMLSDVFDPCAFIYYLITPLPVSKKTIYCVDNLNKSILDKFNEEKAWENDPALIYTFNEEFTIWKGKDKLSNRYLISSANEGAYINGITIKHRRIDGGCDILTLATNKELSKNHIESHYPVIIKIIKEFNNSLARSKSSSSENNTIVQSLSFREIEVIKLAADGYTSEETAEFLFVTKSTVNFHLKKIIIKLGCTNKTQAVAKALLSNIL